MNCYGHQSPSHHCQEAGHSSCGLVVGSIKVLSLHLLGMLSKSLQETLVYKLVQMMFRTSSLQISPLVNRQHMGHPSSCVQDLFQYRTSHDYWMISSRVKVKLGSRIQFGGHSQ